MASTQASQAILSILLEAKEAGVGKLTRTALVKFLYLLDLYTAEETGGKTWTEASWVFLHFGPYAQSLADEVDSLARRGILAELSGGGTAKDYTLYTLGEWSSAKSFEHIGLPRDVRMRLADDIRRLSGDLPALLDKIYFQTAPMECVRPNDALSFQSAKKVDYKTDVRPIPIPVTDPAKARKIKELLRKIGESYSESVKSSGEAFATRILDEHYVGFERALSEDEGDAPEGELVAELSFGED